MFPHFIVMYCSVFCSLQLTFDNQNLIVKARSWEAFNGASFFLEALDTIKNESAGNVLLLPRHTLMKIGYLEQYLNDSRPLFHYLVFLRDPRERVLSGYFDRFRRICGRGDTAVEDIPMDLNGCAKMEPFRVWLNDSGVLPWGKVGKITATLQHTTTHKKITRLGQ